MRALIAAAAAGALILGPAAATTAATSATTATVIRVIDGDTIVTTRGTVRVIGIDTPERGRCGYQAATDRAKRLAPRGATVRLTHPGGRTDIKDRYNRILRYVAVRGADFGGSQIRSGLAKARYDSRDGYAWHPKQPSYVRWDKASRDVCNGSAWTGSRPSSGSSPSSGTTVTYGAWNRPGPDLDCADIPARYRPVRITGTDYHRLDRDGNGWACA